MAPNHGDNFRRSGALGNETGRSPGLSEDDRRSEREALLASLPVRERAEARKRLEEEQYEEALRQARIEAAAERRMAADRARARMNEGTYDSPVGDSIAVRVAVPSSNHHASGGVKSLKTAKTRQKSKNPFGDTWDDSTGGGWAMLDNNLLDDEPPAQVLKPRNRSGNGARRGQGIWADSPQNTQNSVRERQERAKQRDQDQHKAALNAARKEAAAERCRLMMLQQRAESGDGGQRRNNMLANADPAAIDAMGWEAFQRMLDAPEVEACG